MIKGIGHVGVKVKNLDESIRLYQKLLNAELKAVVEKPEIGVRVAIFSWGEGANLELLEVQPESSLNAVLGERNEISHIAFEVDNIEKETRRVREEGMKFLVAEPSPGIEGSYVFIHPESTGGGRLELLEPFHKEE